MNRRTAIEEVATGSDEDLREIAAGSGVAKARPRAFFYFHFFPILDCWKFAGAILSIDWCISPLQFPYNVIYRHFAPAKAIMAENFIFS